MPGARLPEGEPTEDGNPGELEPTVQEPRVRESAERESAERGPAERGLADRETVVGPPPREPASTLASSQSPAPERSPTTVDAMDQTLLLSYHDTLERPYPKPRSPATFDELSWRAHYEVIRPLGRGAQGTVYLARREGVDGYATHVALKVFDPPENWTTVEYVCEMERIAGQAERISQIQHDSLVSIRDFVAIGDGEDQPRVMVLEWVDGFDLERLLDLQRLRRLEARLPRPIREHLNDVIVTAGRDHCAIKAGVAVDIVRGCLAALSALHHERIAHCDLKPSNIMIKRTGTKKIIDVDSSCVVSREDPQIRGTPYYMAPEQLEQKPIRLRSDVASLGYVLIELLTGERLFGDCVTKDELLVAKQTLPDRLDRLLPAAVRDDPFLFQLVYKMVAVDPQDRFPDADAAELDRVGAASFHRHLVRENLSTEYDRELAWWLELLRDDGPASPAPPRQVP